jgi:hypothetical protein
MKKIILFTVLFLSFFTFLSFNVFKAEATSITLGTTGSSPQGITIDGAGNIYTANGDSNNVSKITPGGVSAILGTTGTQPSGITIDGAGNIYTANSYSDSNNVSKITPGGVSTILGTAGSAPGAITIDGAGNIYTANSGSNNVSKITPGGVSTILGTTGSSPQSITIDGDGNIYTANYNSNNVSKITPGGVSTILGTTGISPQSITIDGAGNVYTANSSGLSNNVSKITPGGVSTILGTTGISPQSITIDGAGNIYTANGLSNNVSKITPGGVSTILGTTGNHPQSIILDGDGNIYTANSSSNNVTKIINPLHDAMITSGTYTVSTIGGGAETIIDVPFGTTKVNFLASLTAGSAGQTWNDTDISDPVVTGDTLVVTAEDTTTIITYTVTVDEPRYWFNAGADDNWETLTGNWWTDAGHTIQALSLPGSTDAVITVGASGTGPSVDLDTWIEPAMIDASATGITFSSSAQNSLSSGITGDATFFGSASNGANIIGNAIFNDLSTNDGEVSGYAKYMYAHAGTITIANDSWWGGGTSGSNIGDDDLGIVSWIFNGNSFNDGADIDGDATFNDSSYNSGVITSDATFTSASGGTLTLSGSQAWGEVQGIARDIDGNQILNYIFNDNSYTTGSGTINGNAVFNNNSIDSSTITGIPSLFTSAASAVTQTGVTLNGNIDNTGTSVFNDNSQNYGTVSINATFNDTSYSGGTITGDACFNDTSVSDGTVNGVEDTNCAVSTTLVTERGFNYGLNNSYGSNIVQNSAPYDVGTFNAVLTGLTCGTVYHYRAYATNASGTTNGSDATFTTSACSGGTSGSRPHPTTTTIVTPSNTVTVSTACPVGHLFDTATGLPCKTFFTPSNTTTCPITTTLKQGSKGDQVKCLQTGLKILSDGIFGPMTKASVVSFQKLHNLIPDGIFGPKSLAEWGK